MTAINSKQKNSFGAFGVKIGMTRIPSLELKKMIPVTVIFLKENLVIQKKTEEKDGYFSTKLAFELRKKPNNKPNLGKMKSLDPKKSSNMNSFGEIKNMIGFEPGNMVGLSNFNEGEEVIISSVSKGKGNAGVIKKWGFKIGSKSHGAGYPHRLIGSMGGGRGTNQGVPKGKKMPGRMGGNKISLNTKIFKLDNLNNYLFVVGSVPGPKLSKVKIVKKNI